MLKSEKTLDVKTTVVLNSLLYSICAVVVFLFVVAAFQFRVNTTQLADGIPNYYTTDQRMQQLECLAINIYREAGYEPFEGKVAVAQVTLNRANHKKFPPDICQVVYQKNIFYQKVICQFSWYCDAVHRNRPVNPKAYNESYEVAKKVLLENFRLQGLHDALYYHADYVNPKWNLEKVGQIGRHIFYKEKTNI